MKRVNKRRLFRFLAVSVLLTAPLLSFAQSGGGFQITEAVVGAGGGSSANGDTNVDSTAGQAVATGAIGSYPFTLTSGFWNFAPLVPTAAHVSISGRVVDPSGLGLFNAVLYLHTQDGGLSMSRTSPFGYYQFDDVEAGQTVLITVQARRYTYTPRTVAVADNVTGFDFIPEP